MKKHPKIFFFTGSSGSGKTSLLTELSKDQDFSTAIFINFDSIVIPSEEDMIKEYGSTSAWQKAMTYLWINKILSEYQHQDLIFFEGQTNLLYIIDACAENNFNNYKIILVHCENDIRHKRLTENRAQPELINPDMDNWSDFLYRQAIDNEALIIDTSNKTFAEQITWCKANLNL
jgi:dephospho-CoA kinase